MAKIGTLVGKEASAFTDDEKKYLTDMVEALSAKISGEYNVEVYDNTEGTLIMKVENLFIPDASYRFSNSGDVVRPKYMTFFFYKRRCYDEVEDGRFYDWEREELKYISYSVSSTLYGDERLYRHKYTDVSVGLSDGEMNLWKYTYGTEITDLEDDLNVLMDTINYSFKNSRVETKKPLK